MKAIISVLVFLLASLICMTQAIAGATIEINEGVYNEDSKTFTLKGLNFSAFGPLTISISDTFLEGCDVSIDTIECSITGTPAEAGGTRKVRVSAGNSPHANADIDLYIVSENATNCMPGNMISCYTGDIGTLNIGECQAGYRICDASGQWGNCLGAIAPADEICDGLDNDCNGVIDDFASDASTYYGDKDSDGYGDASEPALLCELADGYAANLDDCNDQINHIHPGADEICDGVDDNCNGTIDDNCGYVDQDGDGYTSNVDCDDRNAEVNPGVWEYYNDSYPGPNGDSYDYNCDGVEEVEAPVLAQINSDCTFVSGYYGVIPTCWDIDVQVLVDVIAEGPICQPVLHTLEYGPACR